MGEATMLDARWSGAHREIKLAKTENGWGVTAKFYRQSENPWERAVQREFVFYTTEEALDFAREYMDADPDKLREQQS